jgi:hypothetical protein
MAKNSLFSMMKLPLSGDVTQAINPWSWWVNSMRQFGFININQMESSNPELEQEIIEEVAGYGKQLGRIIEALRVVLDHAQLSDLSREDQQTLNHFQETAQAIAAIKEGYLIPTEEMLDRFLAGLHYLETHDPVAYQKIRDNLQRELVAAAAEAQPLPGI